MLRSLFKTDWSKSAAHLLFLSKIRTPRAKEDFSKSDSWKEVLKEEPSKAIRRFQNEGLIDSAGLSKRLEYKYKVTDLKKLLIKRGLPVSGRKADLIGRLIDADPETMQRDVKGLDLFICTDKGHELAEQYLENEKEKKGKMQEKVLDAMQNHELRLASQLVAAYEAEQVFPRGIGVDWKNYDSSSDVEILSYIFDRCPKVLANLTNEQLEPLRVAAGMFALLWNRGGVAKWLKQNSALKLSIPADDAALLLHSHAIFLRALDEIQQNGFIESVTVNTCNDDLVCSACKELSSTQILIEEMPELPYEKCTSDVGCRCWMLPVVNLDLVRKQRLQRLDLESED
jgi:hypothetical protein